MNSLGIANTYHFENHLVTHGAVTVVYDGDGNRVSETVGGVTTKYMVDTVNPTGYGQVVDELQNGSVTRTYAYGLERISENQQLSATWTPSFYGYDGQGSVRQLTNSTGLVTDSYDYDAFGNLINSTGSTPNNYLFAGEQYDRTDLLDPSAERTAARAVVGTSSSWRLTAREVPPNEGGGIGMGAHRRQRLRCGETQGFRSRLARSRGAGSGDGFLSPVVWAPAPVLRGQSFGRYSQ